MNLIMVTTRVVNQRVRVKMMVRKREKVKGMSMVINDPFRYFFWLWMSLAYSIPAETYGRLHLEVWLFS